MFLTIVFAIVIGYIVIALFPHAWKFIEKRYGLDPISRAKKIIEQRKY